MVVSPVVMEATDVPLFYTFFGNIALDYELAARGRFCSVNGVMSVRIRVCSKHNVFTGC